MKQRPNLPAGASTSTCSAADTPAVVQVKVWLGGMSPMVWRRVLEPSACTLRELHGVFQIGMGWEGIHLYQFSLRATRYGSSELATASPEVTGGVAAAQGRAVPLRVRPEHPLAP